MNSRTLFELIGTAGEELLEHSERDISALRYRRLRRARILAAAIAAILTLTVTAAALAGRADIFSWIWGAFFQSSPDSVPGREVIQGQLDRGQWVGLNGDNIAVIIPESPVKIMLSHDGGESWTDSTVADSEKMEAHGSIREDMQYYGGFIGFFGDDGGYLVLTAAVSMNDQPMRIYLTDDGGATWRETGSPYDSHSSVITGAGFADDKIGFISYRYYVDGGPDIWRTADGGENWERLDVTAPEKYNGWSFTPLTPVFDGEEGVYPMTARGPEGTEETIYMHSGDGGLTWEFR